MQKISTVLPTDTNWYKKTSNPTDTTNHRLYDNDLLYGELGDLVNPDPKWRPYYCKKFYELGKDVVLRLAGEARADCRIDRRRLFSHLLKKQGEATRGGATIRKGLTSNFSGYQQNS